MNNVFSAVNLTGQWIVQSANYSLLMHPDYKSLFVNQIQWKYIKKHKPCLKSIKRHLNEEHADNISVYSIKPRYGKMYNAYYVVFIYQGSSIKSLIKLDQNFAFLNQFMIQSQSCNYLTIKSFKNGIFIVEKIYFLNRNLKLIKSTIQKSNKYAGTSFSSEIRIS